MKCIITIVQDGSLQFYKGIKLNIKDWFIDKNDISSRHEVVLLRMTPKAMFLRFGDDEHWVPRSIIREIKTEDSTLDRW